MISEAEIKEIQDRVDACSIWSDMRGKLAGDCEKLLLALRESQERVKAKDYALTKFIKYLSNDLDEVAKLETIYRNYEEEFKALSEERPE